MQLSVRTTTQNRILEQKFPGMPYALTTLLLVSLVAFNPNFYFVSSEHASSPGGDFFQEWISGHMLREGNATRFYDPAYAQQWEHNAHLLGWHWNNTQYFPMVYPPFYYLLVSPLSMLPYGTALFIWLELMILAYVASWQLLRKMFSQESAVVWLLPMGLIFSPAIESVTSCQKGTVLLFLWTATFLLLQRNANFAAGLIFGCMAFKPQFALPLALLMLYKRQWGFILGGLTTTTLLALLCLPLGIDICSQYVEFSQHATEYLNNSGYDLTKSHSWQGFYQLLLGNTTLSGFLTRVSILATIGWLLWTWRGELKWQSPRGMRQFGSVIMASILLSPHVYSYDLTMLLLPMACLTLERRTERIPLEKTIAILFFVFAGLFSKLAGVTHIQASVPLLFLWMLSLERLERSVTKD